MTTHRVSRRATALFAGLVLAVSTAPPLAASQSSDVVIDQAALIYEINRARWNPLEFRGRADDITMPSSVLPAPPLALNGALTSSAAFKANEIADHGYFGHQSAVTGIWPNELARIHGYPLPSSFADDVNHIESLHGGSPDPFRVLVSFANSDAHRRHIFGEGWFGTHRQIGVGRSANQNYWAVHTAYVNTSSLFVTGFVFDDANGNEFMERGEGRSGVKVTVGSTSVTTNAGGAYSIPISPGSHTITFSGGGLPSTVKGTFTATEYNVQADHVVGGARPIIRAYALCNGLQPTILGSDGDDVLQARPGQVDVIHGLGGNDIIIGAGPSDVICVGSGSATVITNGGSVERYAGATRFETAVALSRATNPNGTDVVYLATGGNYPDALSAGPAAAAGAAPILLAHRNSMPPTTIDELRRLSPSRVVILGGSDVIASGVVSQVRNLLPGVKVSRLEGPTRFETAVAVSKANFGPGVDTVYVTTGLGFADALVSAPAAFVAGGPLLLVRPDEIPTAVRAELSRLAPNRIVIVGSTATVSNAVATALNHYAPSVTRVGGSDRFHTAVEVSKRAFPTGASTVYIAVGNNFPDAMAGGAAGHSEVGPVLLINGTGIPQVVRAELLRLSPQRIVILGGTSVISMAVQVELGKLIG